METAAVGNWYLRKHEEHEIFGPMPFAQLQRWASAARVAPHDFVSADQATWMKAPMLSELKMDWLVEITSERFYGPTTIGAVQEFVRLGEIDEATYVINTCDGSRQRLRELGALMLPDAEGENGAEIGPAAEGMAIDQHSRIVELEEALREERRALAEAEARCRQLEAQLAATAVG